jgi:hypothetical protein
MISHSYSVRGVVAVSIFVPGYCEWLAIVLELLRSQYFGSVSILIPSVSIFVPEGAWVWWLVGWVGMVRALQDPCQASLSNDSNHYWHVACTCNNRARLAAYSGTDFALQ